MTYTKRHADENKVILARAKELLDPVHPNEPDKQKVLKILMGEFPKVPEHRILARYYKAVRIMRNPAYRK